ncbi:uncharacterized protein ACO6RY_19094 [Pungitius sinensis]
MSTFYLSLAAATLCLSCAAAPRGPGPDEAVWREPGEAVTVRCRSSHPKPEYLSLMTGRGGGGGDVRVLFKDDQPGGGTVAPEYRGRLRCSETFPDVDVVIDPLTPADAGRYECVYLKNDRQRRPVELPGTGSVFLVVPQPPSSLSPGERCRDERWDDIAPTTLATCAFVVLVVVVVAWCFAWTLLKACRMSKDALRRRWRQRQEWKKQQRFPLNDVYEDMNATVAR